MTINSKSLQTIKVYYFKTLQMDDLVIEYCLPVSLPVASKLNNYNS